MADLPSPQVAALEQGGAAISLLLSIIIVNWNTRELLAQCLASVYAHRPEGALEVFVVDNASADGSAEMVRARFPQVQLIESAANIGFAAANNLALRRAAGRYLLLLNPDTRLYPQALETLVDFLDRTPQAGAVGPRLLNPDGSLQPSCHPTPTLGRETWRLFHLDRLRPVARYPMHRWDAARPRPVDVVQGACLLLRRRALDQVGLLDERYFMYTEEVDLCYRLRRAGWQVWWVPAARVVHYGGQSTRQVPAEMFLHLYGSKVRFFRKQYGTGAARAYKGLLAVAAVTRILPGWVGGYLPGPSAPSWRNKAALYRRLLAALPAL